MNGSGGTVTGLGLAASHVIIVHHGCAIIIKSEVGKSAGQT